MRTNTSILYILSRKGACVRDVLDEYRRLRIPAQEDNMEKKLYRSRDERMLWGICGGLGQYFGVDPTLIRVITVATLILGGWSLVAYIILRFVVPLEPIEA